MRPFLCRGRRPGLVLSTGSDLLRAVCGRAWDGGATRRPREGLEVPSVKAGFRRLSLTKLS